ncbi:MAG: hypothetical protein NVSMB26_07920 [Beijerinckiaceae bacterium]
MISFRLDVADILGRAKRLASARLATVTVSLPFLSFPVALRSREKEEAREVVIRLRDKRVLNAFECCDECIERALTSLQEIRAVLTEKQVALADFQNGPVFLLLDAMASSIRQFLTYEQRLSILPHGPKSRQEYFDALEVLRAHLSRCLGELAKVGKISLPDKPMIVKYQNEWRLPNYLPPSDPTKSA